MSENLFLTSTRVSVTVFGVSVRGVYECEYVHDV